MTITSFLKLVEIQTKVASVIPFLLGTVFALYKFDTFHLKEAVLFFLSMIVFDMTVTAINNYVDHTKAIKREGFGYEQHNAIGRDRLNPKVVQGVIGGMLGIAVLLGLLLVFYTDYMVLLVGMICFGIGIFYSFGPIPISRTPFGEVFSGITMGCLITFLAVYVHIYDQDMIAILLENGTLSIALDLPVLFAIGVVSTPAVAGIANIMLANNICDMEEDFINKRYTLPLYIGKKAALNVFKWIYYLGFVGIVIGVILGILPWLALITLVTIIPVQQHIRLFSQEQTKAKTFVLAVKSFVMVNVVYILTLIIAWLIK